MELLALQSFNYSVEFVVSGIGLDTGEECFEVVGSCIVYGVLMLVFPERVRSA